MNHSGTMLEHNATPAHLGTGERRRRRDAFVPVSAPDAGPRDLAETLDVMLTRAEMGAGYQWDYVFDWTILKYQQSQQALPRDRLPVTDPAAARAREDGTGTFARPTAGESSRRR